MKRCTNCNRTYTDESLSFCLDDGTPLVVIQTPNQPPNQQPQGYDPQATLFMAEPPPILQTTQVESRTTAGNIPQPTPTPAPPTSHHPTQPSQPSPSQSYGSLQQAPTYQGQFPPPSSQQTPFQPVAPVPTPTWQPPPTAGQQNVKPKKKSKVLPIVIVLIGLVVVGSIGIVVTLLVIAAMNSDSNNNNNKPNINQQSNENKSPNNNKGNTNQTNDNKNTNGNTNANNDVTPVAYLSDGFLSTSTAGGTAQTTFTTNDIIYFHFDVNNMPEAKSFKIKFVVDEVIADPSGKTKDGDFLESKESFGKGKTDKLRIKYTPGKLGWPTGNYHIEVLEIAADETLTKVVSVPFKIE